MENLLSDKNNTKIEPIIVVQNSKYFIQIYKFKIDIFEAKYEHELNRNEASIYPFATKYFKYINDKGIKEFYDKYCIKDDFSYPEKYYTFNDIVQIVYESKEEYFESKKEVITEDSINLFNSGNLYKYMKETYDMLHAGDSELKDIYIYSIMGFGIKNLLVPPHISIYGEGELGKSNIANGAASMLPESHKLKTNGFSSKVLYYLKLRPDILITVNNTTFDDETAKVLDGLSDTDSWNKGYMRDVVLESEAKKQKIPPGVLFHFSSNKRINGYNYKESGLDGAALESKYISLEKKEDLQQKYNAVDNMLNRYINKDEVNNRLMIIRGALSTLFNNKKDIVHPKSHKELLEIGLTPEDGKRRLGRIISLAQGRAYLLGKDKIDINDIKIVFEAYIKVEPTQDLTEEETGIYSFFNVNSTMSAQDLLTTKEFKQINGNLNYQKLLKILHKIVKKRLLVEDKIGVRVIFKRKDWRAEPPKEQPKKNESGFVVPNLLNL